MHSPLAVFAFTGVTDPSKWEYTIYQLPAGLWSPDTVCTEEKGNPVISCLKSDSPRGANCTSKHYLIGRRISYISGSMMSFILPRHLPSGECFLLSWPFLMKCYFSLSVSGRTSGGLFSSDWVWSCMALASALAAGQGMWNECMRL